MYRLQGERSTGWMAICGAFATRVLVPLWLLAGALTKLADLSPASLPSVMVTTLGGAGVDLGFLLRFSIAVELMAVIVIWLLPALARAVSIVMLTLFLAILCGDLIVGASSCGCFGSVQVHPAVTAAIDGLLLVAILLWGGRSASLRWSETVSTWRVLLVGILVVLAIGAAFGGGRSTESATSHEPDSSSLEDLPESGYYLPDYDSWIGRQWADLDLSSWVIAAPADLAVGEQLILLYRKDCEHCHELMELFFAGELPLPVTAVAVPERTGFPTVGLQPMPCVECRVAELPSGIDWFFQTPVAIRLVDGVVECAAEEEPTAPQCVTW